MGRTAIYTPEERAARKRESDARSRAKHRDSEKRRKDEWKAANPERYAATIEAWRAKNAEHIKSVTAEYRAKNRERRRLANAAWRAANKESHDRAKAAWKAANPDKSRVYKQNRRAKESESNGRLSPGLADRLIKLQRDRCAVCGDALGGDYHLDHVVPLALGGENVDSNIQLLHSHCNRSKSFTHPVDFMQRKGFLL